jgi:hypothetical protein
MDSKLDVFMTEGNVEIYLSKLSDTLDPAVRDTILRLLVNEEEKMGRAREHVENGERRVIEGRRRLEQQRIIVARLAADERTDHPAVVLLDTFERTQALLEKHLRFLIERLQQSPL